MFGRGEKIRYGPNRGQFGVITHPSDGASTRLVVLVHGGFWKWPYNRWLMLRLVRSVNEQGWSAFNVEYRRLGRFGGGGGYPATFDDVAAAIDTVAAQLVSYQSVAVVGHSAGAHLALCAAARSPRIIGVVAMAAPTDLEQIARDGSDVVQALTAGAEPSTKWHHTSPLHMVPVAGAVACVHGTGDTTVSADASAKYVKASQLAGGDAALVLIPNENHRDALRPSSQMWHAARAQLEAWFDRA